MVTHQSPGDTFWDIVRKGAEAAAAKDNIKLVYSTDPNAGNQANLVQNAIDQKVDGIAVTLAKPDAMKDVVAKARRPAYPSSASTPASATGRSSACSSYFGQDETIAGEALGNELNTRRRQEGRLRHPGAGQRRPRRQRCDGVKKTFSGTTEILYVNGTDMPSVKSTITAKLKPGHAPSTTSSPSAPRSP